jgi:UDP-glucose 4-epimerase
MNLRNKRVLVTGAGGFIGSHLVEALVAHGAKVTALLRYTSRADAGLLEYLPRDVFDEVNLLRGDIRDAHFLLRACEKTDVIFHLAALIGIPHSYHAPGDYVSTNVTGTLNILEAARICGVSRLVQTSTSETYGTAQYVPIDEKHPLVGQSPYSATKIAADKLAESYYLSFGLPVVTVRPFNTFGPRQSARAIIPTILAQLFSGCRQLRLGSLTPKRDLTFVKDTAAGFLALACCDKAVGCVVNLGTGETRSMKDVACECMSAAGRTVPIATEKSRVRPGKSEVQVLLADARLARRLCGWQPKVSFAEGIAQTAEFVQKNLERYRPGEYQK